MMFANSAYLVNFDFPFYLCLQIILHLNLITLQLDISQLKCTYTVIQYRIENELEFGRKKTTKETTYAAVLYVQVQKLESKLFWTVLLVVAKVLH